MAKSFGFYVIDSRRQFLTPSADITEKALVEVRSELGFSDLVMEDGADDLMTKHFRTFLPREAAGFAERWASTGPALESEFKALRIPGDQFDRADAMRDLRYLAKERLGDRGGW
jgi:hypothetical protein